MVVPCGYWNEYVQLGSRDYIVNPTFLVSSSVGLEMAIFWGVVWAIRGDKKGEL
jgi:hypothetical protein